jgi:multidrug efflux pump subunit AcrB
MKGLIRASLNNPFAVTVMTLTIMILGGLSVAMIPIDILPAFHSPAVQVLTFYSGMPPQDVEQDITNRIERWTNMASGSRKQDSRSILGCSIVRNYFYEGTSPGEALTSVNSLAMSTMPMMPPGTLPPIVLPFDPTSMTPVCLVALNSDRYGEKTLHDVGQYEVRNQIMTIRGAVSPVVFGGKVRAVQVYVNRERMQARHLAPQDVMKAVEDSNVFLPTGEVIIGNMDYFLDSNSLFQRVPDMSQIPLRTEHGNRGFVGDVAQPEDDAMIQTTIVRVNGRKQVYIPVMRQMGASTLSVVSALKARLNDMMARLTRPGIRLEVVMDQSIYVKQSIKSLATEGFLGAVLCSLTILLFLGRWQMTAIAVMTIPLSVVSAIMGLYITGNTINVMTLSGLALAIGPMVDSAIICLENTDRHLEMGAPIRKAALEGASEVALPELVSSLSTLMVLSPLALMPGMGSFLFRPMALAVTFAMVTAYLLSRTLIPTCAVAWLKAPPHYEEHDRSDSGFEDEQPHQGPLARAFAKWQGLIDRFIEGYTHLLDRVLDHRWPVVIAAYGALIVVIALLIEPMRKEFFPEVDSGAFEMFVRAPSGTRIEVTNAIIDDLEKFVRTVIPESDLRLILSEIGVTPDWSSAYTPNAGKMDAIVRIQLNAEHSRSSQEYVALLRERCVAERRFANLEFAFSTGGLIRGALNEGKSTPIDIRITGKDARRSHKIADRIRHQIARIAGVVDARIIQRLNYPMYTVEVDRAKSADLGLTQEDVMKNVIAAFNSSIQYNKNNFWIDTVSGNQYFVGVQYPLDDVKSLETLLNVPITGVNQSKYEARVATPRSPELHRLRSGRVDEAAGPAPVPLSNIVKLKRGWIPTEATHLNIQPSIDVTLNVQGVDLGHVADAVRREVATFGVLKDKGSTESAGTTWSAYDPDAPGQQRLLEGTEIVLSGEYARMRQTFRDLAIGLTLAAVLIYFMMVALDRSFLVPLCVMIAVPLILVGVLPMLYFTGTSINIQSLLGIIFSVGIKVANTVLMTDVAQDLRRNEGLSPTEAIRKAASMRVRPVTMTALAAFFAMIPTALALETGSEANAPLGRAILGGLIAGEPATLFVVPALYSLMIRGEPYVPPADED